MWARATLFLAAAAPAAAATYPADYMAWDRVVKKYINTTGSREGINLHTVDYCGIKADADFQTFLTSLASANATGLSKDGFYALYMNAYNALTINLMITHAVKSGKCITSIQQIGLIPAVSAFTMQAGTVAGKSYSLNQIEGMLRDPSSYGFEEDCRVHGCIVCASISCPNVRAEAYLPEKVDAQMSDNVRDWLANPLKGSALSDGDLTVSKIFAGLPWFKADFTKCSGSPAAFIAQYAPDAVKQYIAGKGADNVGLKFFDYNWDANGDVPCDC